MAGNSMKKEQNRQKELAYMRKVKQTMQPKSDAEREREKQVEQQAHPQSTGDKVSNFLYYYKVRILLILVAVAVGIGLIVNFINQPRYDTKILAVYYADSLQTESYINAVEQYGLDSDENGEVNVDIITVSLSNSSDSTARPKMVTYLNDTSVYLYLLGEEAYEELIDEEPEMFVDLSALFPDNPNVDGQRYFIDGTQFAQDVGEENIPSERMALVLRSEDRVGADEENNPDYDNALAVLTNIINGEKTAQ